jgi:hypothetical protein
MDFFLGILGVLQMTSIPGLIIYKFLRLRGKILDKVLIIFSFSLIFNYCLIFLLSILGIYIKIILIVLVLGELITLIWLYSSNLRQPIKNSLEAVWDGINDFVGFLIPKRPNGDSSSLYYLLDVLFLLLSIKNIIWAFNLFIHNLGTVFSSWDAVVSWNQWAIAWAASQVPMYTRFYPQLIPANWSITYVLLGTTEIQFFAKSIMPLFALLMLLGLFNLSLQTRNYYFLISIVLLGPLLEKFLNIGISNGYVDIAVAFFAFMSIYMLIRVQQTSELDQRDKMLVIGALFSAAAAITKQPGLYIVVCYPVLAFINVNSFDLSTQKKWLKAFFPWLALVSILWISWYLFKGIQTQLGVDHSYVDVLINQSAARYKGLNIAQQILAAIGEFDLYIIILVLVGVAFPLMDRFYKVLTLLAAPYLFLWAWIAAYDTRNLAIFLPLLALIGGYSINKLIPELMKILEKLKIFRIPVYVPLVLSCLLLAGLSVVFSPQRLLQRQQVLQKQIFSPSQNKLLYDALDEERPNTKVLTNYPMEYLPGLKEHKVSFIFQDYDLFLANINNTDIDYILLPNSAADMIKDYITAEISAGNYKMIAKNTEWKKFTFIKILKR